jgi:prephenate dehydrogenase
VRPSSLTVIGLGAIGGSLAWQARLAGIPRVVGVSASRAEGVQALRTSAITELADTPAKAVRGAELVVLAVPAQVTLELIGRLHSLLEPGALLTDVCSVKSPVVARATAEGLGDRFAGGHPLAGTHGSGFAAARADRLRGCVVYVCETGSPGGDQAARRVMSFWEQVLEAHPVLIDAAAHDRQLAWTSHLPQAVASALAKALADRGLAGV